MRNVTAVTLALAGWGYGAKGKGQGPVISAAWRLVTSESANVNGL